MCTLHGGVNKGPAALYKIYIEQQNLGTFQNLEKAHSTGKLPNEFFFIMVIFCTNFSLWCKHGQSWRIRQRTFWRWHLYLYVSNMQLVQCIIFQLESHQTTKFLASRCLLINSINLSSASFIFIFLSRWNRIRSNFDLNQKCQIFAFFTYCGEAITDCKQFLALFGLLLIRELLCFSLGLTLPLPNKKILAKNC